MGRDYFDGESRSEKLWDTPAFENKPMRPARQGVFGEQVFADRWEQLMSDTETRMLPPNGPLSAVLGAYPFDLDQRCATVAASFVTWLGTNCGRAFLHEAQTQAVTAHNRADAYLRTWAVGNSRKSWSNSGARTLEICLKADGEQDLPELSGRDYETAEHVVVWLASGEGQEFLAQCEAEIERRGPEASLEHHLRHNLNLAQHDVRIVLALARKVPTPSPALAN